MLTYLPRSHISPAPSHCPPPCFLALHEFCDRPVVRSYRFQSPHYFNYATGFPQHARIPLDLLFQYNTLIDHTAYECNFTARYHHLDLGASAGAMGRPGFGGGGSEELGRGRVKRRIAHGEVNARKFQCLRWVYPESDGTYRGAIPLVVSASRQAWS